MSVSRRRSFLVLTALVLMAGLTLALAPQGVDREVVLVAREMAYFEVGGAQANPAITVGAGERVRIVLVNEDKGMLHDLAVDALGFVMPVLAGHGSSTTKVLEAPDTPGRYEYVCTYHRQLMRGVLEVVPPGRSGASDRAR